jgi:putative component of membrane protein insertase Oxa1/YidC/SpoIIIJ protein YidD
MTSVKIFGVVVALIAFLSSCSTPIYDQVDVLVYENCLQSFSSAKFRINSCKGFKPEPIDLATAYDPQDLANYQRCLKEKGWTAGVEYLGLCKRPTAKGN